MKIAVSACLMGVPCRFDGKSKPCGDVLALRAGHELVEVCPEVEGGLPVPHPPCEIVAGEPSLRVVDAEGADRTGAFLEGARKTLETVKREGCELAILKAKSPSCGTGLVYDGTFTGTLVPGFGVAAGLLRAEGFRVLDETQLRETLAGLSQRESRDVRPSSCGSGVYFRPDIDGKDMTC